MNLNYGLHAVKALLTKTPQHINQLHIQASRSDKRLNEIIQLAKQHGIRHQQVEKRILDQLIDANHQGVIAECTETQTYQEADLTDLVQNTKNPLFLILDGVQDPHNLGACLRSANAMGVTAVIAPKDNAASLTPTARKVACGAAEVTPFIPVANLSRCLKHLQDLGVWSVGLDADTNLTLTAVDLTGPMALIMGNEGNGLRRLTKERCDFLARIPMHGTVESLNVSVATGMCLYEAQRQRESSGKQG